MPHVSRLAAALALAVTICALPASAAETPVFSDDFSDPTSGWVNTQAASHTAAGIALYDMAGGYQITPLDDATYGVMRAPRQASGADVRIEAGLFLYTGVGQGTGGLVCRHIDNNNFYAFMVSGAHGYAIMKIKGGQSTILASGRFEGTMPNIADVRIAARCEGANLVMSLDGNEIAKASDGELGTGASGLIAMGEKTAGTSAVFDNFALYQISR